MYTVCDLTEDDYTYSDVKYVGKECSNEYCICACSFAASSLLSAITGDFNPTGFLIHTVSDIFNPLEYANGEDPKLMFVRAFRNEVHKIGNITLINLEDIGKRYTPILQYVFEIVKPKELIVFDSSNISKFVGETTPNSTYTISTVESETDLASPNFLIGISAALYHYSILNQIYCKVLYTIEGKEGPNTDTFKHWIDQIQPMIDGEIILLRDTKVKPIDPNRLAEHANHNVIFGKANLKDTY